MSLGIVSVDLLSKRGVLLFGLLSWKFKSNVKEIVNLRRDFIPCEFFFFCSYFSDQINSECSGGCLGVFLIQNFRPENFCFKFLAPLGSIYLQVLQVCPQFSREMKAFVILLFCVLYAYAESDFEKKLLRIMKQQKVRFKENLGSFFLFFVNVLVVELFFV